jgi:hypothetical protein
MARRLLLIPYVARQIHHCQERWDVPLQLGRFGPSDGGCIDGGGGDGETKEAERATMDRLSCASPAISLLLLKRERERERGRKREREGGRGWLHLEAAVVWGRVDYIFRVL